MAVAVRVIKILGTKDYHFRHYAMSLKVDAFSHLYEGRGGKGGGEGRGGPKILSTEISDP